MLSYSSLLSCLADRPGAVHPAPFCRQGLAKLWLHRISSESPITEGRLARESLQLPVVVEPGLLEQEGMMLLFPPSADSSGDGGIRLGTRAGAFALALEKKHNSYVFFTSLRAKRELEGWRDGSVDKGACLQSWSPRLIPGTHMAGVS